MGPASVVNGQTTSQSDASLSVAIRSEDFTCHNVSPAPAPIGGIGDYACGGADDLNVWSGGRLYALQYVHTYPDARGAADLMQMAHLVLQRAAAQP